jgi:hypothetical protein
MRKPPERRLPEAAGQGFEPQLPDPESGVLPLDDPAGRRHCSPELRAVLRAALGRRRVLLRGSSRRGDHRAVFLDDLTRIRRPVLVARYAAVRISLVERVDITFLLVRAVPLAALQPPSKYGTVLPPPATLNLPAHSSSGLGHRPLTAAARVRIPYAPLRCAWPARSLLRSQSLAAYVPPLHAACLPRCLPRNLPELRSRA